MRYDTTKPNKARALASRSGDQIAFVIPGAVVTLPTGLKFDPAIQLVYSSTFAMRPFRKPNSPAGTPVSNPTPPKKLVRKLAAQKDPKLLAVTSTAIALSIGFPFNDTHDTLDDGDTAQGMDAVGRAAYAAVRMAVEITKESSDMCLPLKAVVGAMSALMKNYDVSASCSRTGCLLILLLFPAPANSG